MMEGFYTERELETNFHFKSCGKNVLISKKASLYMTEKMSIGHDVRIDDFALLIGNITIGNYVHIAAFCSLHASMGEIFFEDFSTLSSHVTVYAASDDYSGAALASATIPEKYRNTITGKIGIEKYGLIGAGSVLLPGAVVSQGTSLGSLSLLKEKTESWSVYAGRPCKRIKNRSKKIKKVEKEFLLFKSEKSFKEFKHEI
ncbi:acyltransferase [Eubacterium callanderi]|nr:acyltransferase [Eubacterium callanderi]